MTRHVPSGQPGSSPSDLDWQQLATEAVGSAIEFWGFKHNHGRIWALLYLRGEALTAAQLQEQLQLSKGAVSIATRELEQWGVVRRVRSSGREPWRFEAETDLMGMIGRVLEEREAGMLLRIEEDLARAEQRAGNDKAAPPEARERLARLRRLAGLMHRALGLFLATSSLDLGAAAEVLAATPTSREPRER